jgi:hypothetical protein
VLTIQGAEHFYQLLAVPTKSSAKQDQRAFRPLAQTDRYIFRSIRIPIWVVTRERERKPITKLILRMRAADHFRPLVPGFFQKCTSRALALFVVSLSLLFALV